MVLKIVDLKKWVGVSQSMVPEKVIVLYLHLISSGNPTTCQEGKHALSAVLQLEVNKYFEATSYYNITVFKRGSCHQAF